MGFTDSPRKRAAIRAAAARLIWVDPYEVADILAAPPLASVIAALLHSRRAQLDAAAMSPLSAVIPAASKGNPWLVGVQSTLLDRYLLLDLGYEVVSLVHEIPVRTRDESR